ncbi:TPA: helix-turn-helix transcriptional regulator, partial [Escherichia coli]|nr:helix-turn-helix transcriptional regulator [Escherichia coli]
MARQKKEMLALQNEHFRLQVDLSGSRLTAKEKDVIGLLLAGHGVKAISIMRNRSLKTVSSQKQNAYKKLGVRNDIRTDIVTFAPDRKKAIRLRHYWLHAGRSACCDLLS